MASAAPQTNEAKSAAEKPAVKAEAKSVVPEAKTETAAKSAPKADTAVKTVAKAKVAAKKAAPKKTTTKKTAVKKAATPKKKNVTAKRKAKPARKTAAATNRKIERTTKMATKQNPTETMKAQAETAMKQSQAAMQDMTAKGREAMEKGVKQMEDMGGFARGNVEAMVESGKIGAEGAQDILREQAEFAKQSVEGFSATMKKMQGVKNPNEAMQMHGDFVRGQFDAMVSQTSTMTERMMKLTGEMMAPLQNRVAVANEKFTKVA